MRNSPPFAIIFVSFNVNIQIECDFMNSIFKKRTCDLFRISEKEFDRIFAEKPFRAIRINPLKSDFSTVQKGFDFVLEPNMERDVDKYPTYPIKELLKNPVYTKIRYR